jgi:hypothetical protein
MDVSVVDTDFMNHSSRGPSALPTLPSINAIMYAYFASCIVLTGNLSVRICGTMPDHAQTTKSNCDITMREVRGKSGS